MAEKSLQSVFVADFQAADSWEDTLTDRKKYSRGGSRRTGCSAASWLNSARDHNMCGYGENKQSNTELGTRLPSSARHRARDTRGGAIQTKQPCVDCPALTRMRRESWLPETFLKQ